jgi:hypothetical protein
MIAHFDFLAAHYSYGVNEAGWGMERWWYDGMMAYCLEAVGQMSYVPMTQDDFWTLAYAEQARLTELEDA